MLVAVASIEGGLPVPPPAGRVPAMNDRLLAGVGDDPIALPDEHAVCQICGIAVPGPGEQATSWVPHPHEPLARNGAGRDVPIHLARCRECRERRAALVLAVASAEEFLRRIGSLSLAVDLAERAMAALVVLGRPSDPRTAMDLITERRGFGAGVPWGTRSPGQCNPRPFDHLAPSVRRDLRAAYADHLRGRVQQGNPPVRVLHPDGTGCAWCGISALRVEAARVHRLGGIKQATLALWHPLTNTNEWVCAACHEALTDVGATGPTAIERAYLNSVSEPDERSRIRIMLADHPTGPSPITPWSRSGAEPSSVAWAHLADEGD